MSTWQRACAVAWRACAGNLRRCHHWQWRKTRRGCATASTARCSRLARDARAWRGWWAWRSDIRSYWVTQLPSRWRWLTRRKRPASRLAWWWCPRCCCCWKKSSSPIWLDLLQAGCRRRCPGWWSPPARCDVGCGYVAAAGGGFVRAKVGCRRWWWSRCWGCHARRCRPQSNIGFGDREDCGRLTSRMSQQKRSGPCSPWFASWQGSIGSALSWRTCQSKINNFRDTVDIWLTNIRWSNRPMIEFEQRIFTI